MDESFHFLDFSLDTRTLSLGKLELKVKFCNMSRWGWNLKFLKTRKNYLLVNCEGNADIPYKLVALQYFSQAIHLSLTALYLNLFSGVVCHQIIHKSFCLSWSLFTIGDPTRVWTWTHSLCGFRGILWKACLPATCFILINKTVTNE